MKTACVNVEGAAPASAIKAGERNAERVTFASCFTFDHLMESSRKCMRGCSWKKRAQRFEMARLTECRKLQRELEAGTYRLSHADRFTVMERGKPRDVKSINFRDRVVQRCLCDHAIVPVMERYITDSNSAALPGRGPSYAYAEVRRMAERAHSDTWVLQFDFSAFFASIDHEALLRMLAGFIDDERLMDVLALIIRENEVGLELGSHVSQVCATCYPTPLDRAIEALPGVTGYHRYMDDGIAFCETKADAKAARATLETYTEALGLTVNEKKTHINKIEAPFVFCKMRYTKRKDGSVRMNVRKPQSKRMARHMRAVARQAEARGIDLEPVRASCLGYLNRGDADLTRIVARELW